MLAKTKTQDFSRKQQQQPQETNMDKSFCHHLVSLKMVCARRKHHRTATANWITQLHVWGWQETSTQSKLFPEAEEKHNLVSCWSVSFPLIFPQQQSQITPSDTEWGKAGALVRLELYAGWLASWLSWNGKFKNLARSLVIVKSNFVMSPTFSYTFSWNSGRRVFSRYQNWYNNTMHNAAKPCSFRKSSWKAALQIWTPLVCQPTTAHLTQQWRTSSKDRKVNLL